MNRRGGSVRYDAKKMTMRKFINFDSDIASRFDDEDEGTTIQVRIAHLKFW